MEAAQKNRSQHDIITIRNIDSQLFEFEYDRSQGTFPYRIEAGKVARFPRYLANHAMKHLINKIMNKRDQNTNNQVIRDRLAGEIFIDEEVFQQKTVNQAEEQKKRIDELNKPGDLERILGKIKGKEKDKAERNAKVPSKKKPNKFTASDDDNFEQINEEKKAEKGGVVKATPPKKESELEKESESVPENKENPKEDVGESDVIALPTRKQLMTHAETNMGITMTKKTEEAFNKMEIKQLVKELDYPLI